MNKILLGGIIAAILLLLVLGSVAYFILQPQQTPNQTSQATTTSSQTGQVKFSDTPDAQYAYLISTDSYDAATKQALAGFEVIKSAQSNGSVQYTLKATNPEYKTQTYTVKPGEKLYFIEKYLQDDPNGQEKNLGDDAAVVVDANGYIVQ